MLYSRECCSDEVVLCRSRRNTRMWSQQATPQKLVFSSDSWGIIGVKGLAGDAASHSWDSG